MSTRGTSNFESFLEHISPNIVVNFYTQGSCSSSSSRDKEEEGVRKPYVVLRDIWSAYEEWSIYAVGVPLKLMDPSSNVTYYYVPIPSPNVIRYYLPSSLNVTQYYVPYLSALQIFTKTPLVGGSSSRSFGRDCYLHFQFNETMSFDKRPPLSSKVDDLAKQHHELNYLTTSDISPSSWFSVAWSPIYGIPRVTATKALSVMFLTYHSLTPVFPETFPQEEKVGLPPFGVVTSKLSDIVWNMPQTLDPHNIKMLEESAVSWLKKLMFKHNDFDLFMAERSSDLPLPRGW